MKKLSLRRAARVSLYYFPGLGPDGLNPRMIYAKTGLERPQTVSARGEFVQKQFQVITLENRSGNDHVYAKDHEQHHIPHYRFGMFQGFVAKGSDPIFSEFRKRQKFIKPFEFLLFEP